MSNPNHRPPLVTGKVTAAGTFTDIYDFSPPTGVKPGNSVDISCYVQNLYSTSIYIATTCVVSGAQIEMSPEYAAVASGASRKFAGRFTMPQSDVNVTIYSWYWSGADWILDDQETKTIKATYESQYRDLSIQSYTPVVREGQYCDVVCRLEHIGQTETREIYVAIGNSGIFGFDEILHKSQGAYVYATSVWRAFHYTVRILITSAIAPGIYDLYAKLNGITPVLITDPYKDVIKVESSEPVFSNLSATYRVVG